MDNQFPSNNPEKCAGQTSEDEEKYVDAPTLEYDSEKIVDDLIEQHKKMSISPAEQDTNCSEQLNEELDKEAVQINDQEKFVDCKTDDTDIIDDESQRDFEKNLTEDEKNENRLKSEDLKNQGNTVFKDGNYEKSVELYTNGLRLCPVDCGTDRAVLYANRAAAKIKLELKQGAIDDCNKAIEFNPNYVKAYLRRAKLYEETEKLDESLEDYKKIVELDKSNADAQQALVRLPPKIHERNEKLKEEMVDKLKGLGNMILKPFGLSTNNFKMQQDPSTGSYSINFKQN